MNATIRDTRQRYEGSKSTARHGEKVQGGGATRWELARARINRTRLVLRRMTTLPAAPSSPLLVPCLFFLPVLKRKRKKKKKKKKESFYQRVKARTSSPPLAILSSNFAASRVSWKRIYPPKLGRNTRGHTSWMYSGNDSFHQLSRFEEGGGGKKSRGRLFATKRILSLKHFLFLQNLM